MKKKKYIHTYIQREKNILLNPPLSLCTVRTRHSVYSGSPPTFLERSLDLLWVLYGQLRLRSGPTPTCSCSQSPQLPPKSTALGSLWGFNLLHLWLEEHIPFLFFHPTTPGAQLWFWPCFCLQATLQCLFPTQMSEREQQLIRAHLLSLTWERE